MRNRLFSIAGLLWLAWVLVWAWSVQAQQDQNLDQNQAIPFRIDNNLLFSEMVWFDLNSVLVDGNAVSTNNARFEINPFQPTSLILNFRQQNEPTVQNDSQQYKVIARLEIQFEVSGSTDENADAFVYIHQENAWVSNEDCFLLAVGSQVPKQRCFLSPVMDLNSAFQKNIQLNLLVIGHNPSEAIIRSAQIAMIVSNEPTLSNQDKWFGDTLVPTVLNETVFTDFNASNPGVVDINVSSEAMDSNWAQKTDVDSDSEQPTYEETTIPTEEKIRIRDLPFQEMGGNAVGITTEDFALQLIEESASCKNGHCTIQTQLQNKTKQYYCFAASELMAQSPEITNSQTSVTENATVVRPMLETKTVVKPCVEGTIEGNACFVRGKNILNESFARRVTCETIDEQNNCTVRVNKKVAESRSEETIEKNDFKENCLKPEETKTFKLSFDIPGTEEGSFSIPFGAYYSLNALWKASVADKDPLTFEEQREETKIDQLAKKIVELKNFHKNKRFFKVQQAKQQFNAFKTLFGEIQIGLECDPKKGPKLDINQFKKKNLDQKSRRLKSRQELKNEFEANFFSSNWEQTGIETGQQSSEGSIECDGVQLTNQFRSDRPNPSTEKTISLGGSPNRVKQSVVLVNNTSENQQRVISMRFSAQPVQLETQTETIQPMQEYQDVGTEIKHIKIENFETNLVKNSGIKFEAPNGQVLGMYDWSDIAQQGIETDTLTHQQNNQTIIETVIKVSLAPFQKLELDPTYDLSNPIPDYNSYDAAWDGASAIGQLGYTYYSGPGTWLVNVDNNSYANDLLITAVGESSAVGRVYLIKDIDKKNGDNLLASTYDVRWRHVNSSAGTGRSSDGINGTMLLDLDGNGYKNDLLIVSAYDNFGSTTNGSVVLIKDIDKKSGDYNIDNSANYAAKWYGPGSADRIGDTGASSTTGLLYPNPGVQIVNMDGNSIANDLIITSYLADTNAVATDTGSVWLIRDINTITGDYNLGVSTSYNVRWRGAKASDNLSSTNVSGPGVIVDNMDGGSTKNDILIAAYAADVNGSKANNGAVYLITNVTTLAAGRLADLNNTANFTAEWNGGYTTDNLTNTLQSGPGMILANVDNGAYNNDLILSAYLADANASVTNVGAVYLIRNIDGYTGWNDLNVTSKYTAAWLGKTASDQITNTNFSGPGVFFTNIDNNAYANDLFITGYLTDGGPVDSGAVYLIKDIDSKSGKLLFSSSANYAAKWYGGTTTDRVGDNNRSGQSVQIVNADNGAYANDLVLSANLIDMNKRTNSGAVFLIKGIDTASGDKNLSNIGSPVYSSVFYGAANDEIGSNVSDYNSAQLVNSDGGSYANDLLISAHVFSTPASGAGAAVSKTGGVFYIKNADALSGTYDLNNSNNFSAAWAGGTAADWLGYTLGGSGFQLISADGGTTTNDLLLSAPYADINAKTNNGGAYLIKNIDTKSGLNRLSSTSNYDVLWNGGSTNDTLGYTLRSGPGNQAVNVDGGDYNNDFLLHGANVTVTSTGNANAGIVYLIKNYDENNLAPEVLATSLDSNRITAEHRPKITVSFSAYVDQCNYAYYENNSIRGYGTGAVSGRKCWLQTFFLKPGITAFWDVNGTNAYGTGVNYRTKAFTYQTYWDSNADYNVSVNAFDYNFSHEIADRNLTLNGELDWNNSTANQAIADQNLVFWMDFEDGNATHFLDNIVRNDGNNNAATITGNALLRSTGLLGSKALDLNGSSYATMQQIGRTSFPSSNFSISLWLKTTKYSASTYYGWVLDTKLAGTNNAGFDLRLEAGTLQARVANGSAQDQLTVALDANKWHHVVFTVDRDTNTLKLYRNGTETSASLDIGGSFGSTYSMMIGNYNTNSDPTYMFQGLMDDIRVYSKALSASDANQLYKEGIVDQNLVGYWKFNSSDYNGTFIQDFSLKNNDGQFKNEADINATGLFDSNAGFFDGINDYIKVSNPTDLNFGGGNFSVIAWVKPRTTSASSKKILEYNNAGANQFSLSQSSAGNTFGFSVGGTLYTSTGTITANRWYQVAMVFDTSGTWALYKYINGSLDSTEYLSDITWSAVNDNLTIGANEAETGEYWDGLIEEVKIYNRILSATEIEADYNRWWNAQYYSKVFDSMNAGYSSGHWNRIDLNADINAVTNQVRLQVRGCANSNCSDGAFSGPDGTTTTYYPFSSNGSVNLSNVDDNRYFQYKLYLDFNNANSNNLRSLPKVSRADVNYTLGNTAPKTNLLNPTKRLIFGVNDGNGSIDFNVLDDSNYLKASIYYSSTARAFSNPIVQDLNLYAILLNPNADWNCSNNNGAGFLQSQTCHYDWNILNMPTMRFVIDLNVADYSDRNAVASSDGNNKIHNWLTSSTNLAVGYNNKQSMVRTSDGNLWLVYQDAIDGNAQVFVSYSDNNGSTWKTPLALMNRTFNTNTATTVFNPAIDVNSGNGLHIVWADSNGTQDDIHYRSCPAQIQNCLNINNWAMDLNLSADNNNSAYPAIRIGSDGNVHVVWAAIVSGQDQAYYSQCASNCSSSGNWSAPIKLTPNGSPTGTNFYYPSISIKSNGSIGIVTQFGTGAIGNNPLNYHECTSNCISAASWSAATSVATSLQSPAFAAFFYDKNGTAIAVANRYTINDSNVYYCNTNCTTAGNWSNMGFSPRAASGRIALAADLDNNTHFLWALPSGTYDINYARREFSTASLTATTTKVQNNSIGSYNVNTRLDTNWGPGSQRLDYCWAKGNTPDYNIACQSDFLANPPVPSPLPDMNVWRIDENPDNKGLPYFSYNKDGNLTIDFNVYDPDSTKVYADINYSTSQTPGTGTPIATNLDLASLGSTGPYKCNSTVQILPFNPARQCAADWNILNIPDANYWIHLVVRDGEGNTDQNTSDNSFNVAPYIYRCGTYTGNQNWTDRNTYYVDCNVTFSNADLNVQAGAVVKFNSGNKITFSGSGKMLVTGNKDTLATDGNVGWAYFTSKDDNSIGLQIKTSDGVPTASDWYGINLNGTSTTSDFNGIKLRYSTSGIRVTNGSLTSIQNSDLNNNSQYAIFLANTTNITMTAISNNDLNGGASALFLNDGGSGTTTIKINRIGDNNFWCNGTSSNGITNYMNQSAVGIDVNYIENNFFKDCNRHIEMIGSGGGQTYLRKIRNNLFQGNNAGTGIFANNSDNTSTINIALLDVNNNLFLNLGTGIYFYAGGTGDAGTTNIVNNNFDTTSIDISLIAGTLEYIRNNLFGNSSTGVSKSGGSITDLNYNGYYNNNNNTLGIAMGIYDVNIFANPFTTGPPNVRSPFYSTLGYYLNKDANAGGLLINAGKLTPDYHGFDWNGTTPNLWPDRNVTDIGFHYTAARPFVRNLLVSPSGGSFTGNTITIDFNVQSYDFNAPALKFDLNYSTSSKKGTGTVIVTDANLSTAATCTSNDLDTNRECTYNWGTSGVPGGTYFVLLQVRTDNNRQWAFDASDQNFIYTVTQPTYAPDINVTRIDGNPDNGGLPYFSYNKDGNLTIDFNVQDTDTNSLLVDINYSTNQTPGTGTTMVDDLNIVKLGTTGAYKCQDTNFQNSTQCSVDWNIWNVSDSNYWIHIFVTDGSLTDQNTSDNSFNVAPYIYRCGTYNDNQTWGDGNTYYVDCNVTFNAGILTVQGGAVVKFNYGKKISLSGNSRITVTGNKTTLATDGNIAWAYFTSKDDNSIGKAIASSDGVPSAGDWYGISNGGVTTSDINGMNLRYSITGISSTVGMNSIQNSDLNNNSQYAIFISDSGANVTMTSINNNDLNGGASALYLYDGGTGTTNLKINRIGDNNFWCNGTSSNGITNYMDQPFVGIDVNYIENNFFKDCNRHIEMIGTSNGGTTYLRKIRNNLFQGNNAGTGIFANNSNSPSTINIALLDVNNNLFLNLGTGIYFYAAPTGDAGTTFVTNNDFNKNTTAISVQAGTFENIRNNLFGNSSTGVSKSGGSITDLNYNGYWNNTNNTSGISDGINDFNFSVSPFDSYSTIEFPFINTAQFFLNSQTGGGLLAVDHGNGTAIANNVGGRSTQTNGLLDAGTVDVGFHYVGSGRMAQILTPNGGGIIGTRDGNYGIIFYASSLDSNYVGAQLWWGVDVDNNPIADLNLYAIAINPTVDANCTGNGNFSQGQTCYYDWNVLNLPTFKGKTSIALNIDGGSYASVDTSDSKFKIHNWLTSGTTLALGYGNKHSMVRTSDGNLWLVYQDAIDRNNWVFITQSDNNGSTWKTPLALSDINFDTAYTGGVKNPAIDINSTDGLHVAWADSNGTQDDIHYRNCPSTLNCLNRTNWTADLNISTDNNNSGFPAIAISSDGNIHLVWSNYGSTSSAFQSYYVQCGTLPCSSSNNWTSPVRLSKSTAGNSFYDSAISIKSNNTIGIVAQYDPPTGEFVDYFECTGNCTNPANWNTGTQIDNVSSGWPTFANSFAFDYNDTAVVMTPKNSTPVSYETKTCNVGCTTAGNWSTGAFSPNPSGTVYHDLAIDLDKNTHFLWAVGQDINYARRDSSGTMVATTRKSSRGSNAYYLSTRKKTWWGAGSQRLDYAWAEGASADYNIIVLSDFLANPAVTANAAPDANMVLPIAGSIFGVNDGNVSIDFNASDDSNYLYADIYYSDATGTFQNLIIQDLNLYAVLRNPSVDWNCTNTNGKGFLQRQTCHYDWNILNLPTQKVYIDVNVSDKQDANKAASTSQKIKIHNWLTSSTSDATAPENNQKMVRTADGNLWIVYHDSIDKSDNVFISRSNSNGNTWETPIDLTDRNNSNTYPIIDTNSTNGLHVFWIDNNGSQNDISYKTCNAGIQNCLLASNWSQDLNLTADNNASTPFSATISSNGTLNVAWMNSGRVTYMQCTSDCTSINNWSTRLFVDAGPIIYQAGTWYIALAVAPNDKLVIRQLLDETLGSENDYYYRECTGAVACTSLAGWSSMLTVKTSVLATKAVSSFGFDQNGTGIWAVKSSASDINVLVCNSGCSSSANRWIGTTLGTNGAMKNGATAFDSDKRSHILWEDSSIQANGNIYYGRRDANGSFALIARKTFGSTGDQYPTARFKATTTATTYQNRLDYAFMQGSAADYNIVVASELLNRYPDANITKIDGNLDTNQLGIFNYFTDGNLTIDFNVQDWDNNNLIAALSYMGDSTGSIVTDLNLSKLGTTGPYKCQDTNFQNSTQCSIDWNIFNIADGNYNLQLSIVDGNDLRSDTSNQFRIVNNRAPDLNVIKPEINGDPASTDYNVVWRADDNDAGDSLKTACYADTDNIGYTQTYTCFTNVDTNKGQVNSKICDLSTWNSGDYYIWCELNDQRNSNNSVTQDYSQGFISQAIVSIVLRAKDLNLGTLYVLDRNTSEGDKNGIWIENNGNVKVDINISATILFTQSPTTSSYFQFKVKDVEIGSLGPSSDTNYTNTPIDSNRLFANTVDYASSSNEIRVDLNVLVPSDEPGGQKRTVITFLAIQH